MERLVEGLYDRPQREVSDYFEELIRRFEPLLRHAWRRGAFATEYNEYAQDVFLTLFGSLPRLRSPKAFPGYFRRVALSVAADHARKDKGLPLNDPKVEDVVNRFDDVLFTPMFVRSYLEHLPAREKEVLTLKYLQDYSIPEIAEQLGLTVGATRSIKSRGLKRLRDILIGDTQALEKK